MHRLDLDLIAQPRLVAEQLEIADKVPPGVADLAELGRVLHERVAERDAAVPRRETEEALKRTREQQSHRAVGGRCRERKRGRTVERVL